jgi:BirA family biotin operon repressor/biotin-[acetyl-CoA-carboxylase] ligase
LDIPAFSAEKMVSLIPEIGAGLDIRVLREAESTNTLMKALALDGAPEGTVLIAEKQSGGRGRLGRSFFSPPGGLYMSLLIKPQLKPQELLFVTPAAAVSAAQSVEKLIGAPAEIKWVNDVFRAGRKLCGILCESVFSSSGALAGLVVGIGANMLVDEAALPPELRGIAGCVFTKDNLPEYPREEFAAAFVSSFLTLIKKLPETDFLEEYRRRSCVIGKEVEVFASGKTRPAIALAIDNNCRLLVRYDDGSKEYLSSGDISIRAKD